MVFPTNIKVFLIGNLTPPAFSIENDVPSMKNLRSGAWSQTSSAPG